VLGEIRSGCGKKSQTVMGSPNHGRPVLQGIFQSRFAGDRSNILRLAISKMLNLKVRLFALVLILLFAGMTYYNWHQLHSDGKYSLKMAAFGPVGIVGGLFLLFFPSKVGKPQTLADKLIVLGVLILGLAAGLVNWYLMDPGYFGR
jgi:peptidoglycan/LPS O-acetylase OafA/YrhL